MLESGLEKTVCESIKRCGGKAYKWVSPGRCGVPDRICFFPNGKVVLIELKQPGRGNGLSPKQKKEIDMLRSLGMPVWVISSKGELRVRLEELGYGI